MDVSNSFYGKTDRYVSRQRLQTMLDYEYGRLQEELDAKRGDNKHREAGGHAERARGAKPAAQAWE